MKKSVAIHTNDHPTADHRIEEWFDSVKNQEIIHFSNNTQFIKLRLEHVKGNIHIDHFQINGEQCKILESGDMDYVPDGFFDTSFDMVRELSRLIKKAKS